MPQDATKPRVLIVEDNLRNAELLERALHRQGYPQVTSAGTPQEARVALDRTDPQVIVVDLDLLIIDGYELLDELRRSTRWSGVPVLALVSRHPAATIRAATTHGVNGFMAPPFTALELTYKIEQAVHGVGPRAAEISDLGRD